MEVAEFDRRMINDDEARALVGRPVVVVCGDGTEIAGVLDQVSASGALLIVTDAGERVVRIWDTRTISEASHATP